LVRSNASVVDRWTGTKSSPSTVTKFEGKSPIIRLSRRRRPIHHEPSPALRHSIRSPSTKPKSLFDSPPQEYTARHQHGNFVGSCGGSGAMAIYTSRLGTRRAGGQDIGFNNVREATSCIRRQVSRDARDDWVADWTKNSFANHGIRFSPGNKDNNNRNNERMVREYGAVAKRLPAE
jgi:hypothetical protein